MRITQEQFIQFSQALLSKCLERAPAAQIELKQSPTGLFLVIIHSEDKGSLQCESECYTIDPISREWIKTYGEI